MCERQRDIKSQRAKEDKIRDAFRETRRRRERKTATWSDEGERAGRKIATEIQRWRDKEVEDRDKTEQDRETQRDRQKKIYREKDRQTQTLGSLDRPRKRVEETEADTQSEKDT